LFLHALPLAFFAEHKTHNWGMTFLSFPYFIVNKNNGNGLIDAFIPTKSVNFPWYYFLIG